MRVLTVEGIGCLPSVVTSRLFFALAVLSSLLAGGCADEMSKESSHAPATTGVSSNLQRNEIPGATSNGEDGSTRARAVPKTKGEATKRSSSVSRKIIYDARVELQVESLPTVDATIVALIKAHDGFLVESDQSNVTRTQGRATWKVRVPVDHFDAFLAAISRFGEVRQSHVGSVKGDNKGIRETPFGTSA